MPFSFLFILYSFLFSVLIFFHSFWFSFFSFNFLFFFFFWFSFFLSFLPTRDFPSRWFNYTRQHWSVGESCLWVLPVPGRRRRWDASWIAKPKWIFLTGRWGWIQRFFHGIGGRINERMNKWMDHLINKWSNEWMDYSMNEWMNLIKQMDGRMNKCVWMNYWKK